MLYYFSHIINFQTPAKKYNSKYFEVSEFNYGDFKVVECSFNQLVRGNTLVLLNAIINQEG